MDRVMKVDFVNALVDCLYAWHAGDTGAFVTFSPQEGWRGWNVFLPISMPALVEASLPELQGDGDVSCPERFFALAERFWNSFGEELAAEAQATALAVERGE